jgi:hypothetical protein
MKKFNFVLYIFAMVIAASCNNNASENTQTVDESVIADTLFKEVMDGHNVGMAKTHKIPKMVQEAQRIVDSILKLPLAARQEAEPYRARLDSLIKDLNYADFAMNKWMEEFDYDSARNDVKKRINYLTDEKFKVNKVRDAILGSFKKADSLIRY